MRRVLKPILCLLVLLLSVAPNLSACQLMVCFGLTPHHHHHFQESSELCGTERQATPHRCCGHHHHHGDGDHHGHHHEHDGHHDSSTGSPPDGEPCSGDCLDTQEIFFGPVTRTSVDVPSSLLPFWNSAEDHTSLFAFCKFVRGQRAPPNEARPPGSPPAPALTGCYLC